MSTEAKRPGRRLDASMTLLTEVMERPLDPGYAAAAERRRARGETPGGSTRTPIALAVLVLVGLLLTAAGLQARGQTTTRVSERDQLVSEIQKLDGAAGRLAAGNAKLQAQIEADRAQSLQQQAQGGLADQVKQLALATGALAMAGPGLTLTVDDAQSVGQSNGGDPRAGTAEEDGRVLDQDLQLLVNGLWAAGAEGISINGQRLTALSAIRSAGQAILVDYRPLAPPYRILAVGDPDTLQTRFSDGAGGRDLQYLKDNFGIRARLAPTRRVTLPASSGLDVHHAQPLVSPTPTASSTSGSTGSSPTHRATQEPS